ncbi:hypothetical protein [Diaphorobacter sp. ED-3]|uniref:hypothetical protein n=1 Tax=Diaphorobacter sp. ED-3 TaxID=3016636 RepID=UPI0022DE546D|nr:hypothetical protein [Diaphorobacter sp. ED-3]
MLGLTLFRSTLLLPLAVPAIAVLLRLEVAGFLGIATFVVAAPYTIFVFWAWKHMGRFASFREAYIFLAKVPVIFAIPIGLLWFLGLLATAIPFSTALKSTSQLLAVLVGTAYLYSVIAALLVTLAQAVGLSDKYKGHE